MEWITITLTNNTRVSGMKDLDIGNDTSWVVLYDHKCENVIYRVNKDKILHILHYPKEQ